MFGEHTHSACNHQMDKFGINTPCCFCTKHDCTKDISCPLQPTTDELLKWADHNPIFENVDGIIAFNIIKSFERFATTHYIPRKALEKLLEQGHGGGNWRRLIMQLLEK